MNETNVALVHDARRQPYHEFKERTVGKKKVSAQPNAMTATVSQVNAPGIIEVDNREVHGLGDEQPDRDHDGNRNQSSQCIQPPKYRT
jgi:hypothetical protein